MAAAAKRYSFLLILVPLFVPQSAIDRKRLQVYDFKNCFTIYKRLSLLGLLNKLPPLYTVALKSLTPSQ